MVTDTCVQIRAAPVQKPASPLPPMRLCTELSLTDFLELWYLFLSEIIFLRPPFSLLALSIWEMDFLLSHRETFSSLWHAVPHMSSFLKNPWSFKAGHTGILSTVPDVIRGNVSLLHFQKSSQSWKQWIFPSRFSQIRSHHLRVIFYLETSVQFIWVSSKMTLFLRDYEIIQLKTNSFLLTESCPLLAVFPYIPHTPQTMVKFISKLSSFINFYLGFATLKLEKLSCI